MRQEGSDKALWVEAGQGSQVPVPGVFGGPTRRQFTAGYRLRPLEEADRRICPDEVGWLPRRGSLYPSHLSARRSGSLRGQTPGKRGVKPAGSSPPGARVRRTEAKAVRLEREIAPAHTISDVQGKDAGLPGLSLIDGKDC